MKFLYIIKQPLTVRDCGRFGIDCALLRGHAVTVLDLTGVMYPDVQGERQDDLENRHIQLVVIRDWTHFKTQKHLFAESDLVFLLTQSYGLSLNNFIPLMMLKACKTPYLILAPALYPGWDFKIKQQTLFECLADLWNCCYKMNLVNSIIARLPPALFGAPLATFLVKRGDPANWRNSLVGPETIVIEAHTDDYDLFLIEKAKPAENKNQVVFIDQFMPFHLSFQELGASKIDPEAYYDGLRRLFDRIEREFKTKVIIAAHPRAKYQETPDFFGGRKIVYGQTSKLIAESRLVLTHHSTAIGIAVMQNKPLMLLTSKQLYRCHVYEKCIYDSLADELGTPLRYFDNPEATDLEGAFVINSELYDRYIKTYLRCKNAPSKPYWENVMKAAEAALEPKDKPKKFVYLIKQPLSQRDWKRYGIGFMLKRGHDVTVMDLSDIIHPNLPNDRRNQPRFDGVNHIIIRGWRQFREQASFLFECDLVFFLAQSFGVSRNIFRCLRLLGKSHVPYLIMSQALYPGWQNKEKTAPFRQKLKNIFARLRRVDLINSLISRLPPTLFNIPRASFFVQRSSHKDWSNNLIGPNTKIIKAHTDDYELFLEEKDKPPAIKNQAVFLDQFLPFHVDTLAQNYQRINVDIYYASLRQLFDRIERELGVNVVIASHPRANYNQQSGLFGDRQLITGKTSALIAESRLVLAHYSTAIGIAVMWKKPVMLLASQELINFMPIVKNVLDSLAVELGTPLHLLDAPEKVNLSHAFDVNAKLYEKHLNAYLKCPDASPKPLWTNIADTINQSLLKAL